MSLLRQRRAAASPPPLPSLREALAYIRSGRDDVKRITQDSPPRAQTAVSGSRASSVPLRQTVYISSVDEINDVLPRPVSPGILCATQIAQFDELAQRKVFDLTQEDTVNLSADDVETIYVAKCQDQHCLPTNERWNRFLQLMSKQCKGQWFVLRECGIGPECCATVCRVLQRGNHYTHLDLSGNDLGPDGATSLGTLLRDDTSLCVLRLQAANLGAGIFHLAESLKSNATLTALDLSGLPGMHRNNVWGSSVRALCDMLHANTVLSHLNLGSCGLQRSTISIVRACASHPALSVLNVYGNCIRDECAEAIAELLRSGSCALETLDLSHNQLTCEGAGKIAKALISGGLPARSISTLVLSHNMIGCAGAEAIGEALTEHPSLSSVCLSGNPLSLAGNDEEGFRLPDDFSGIDALFAGAQSTENLLTLKLAECKIHEVPQSFVNFLGKNYNITSLDMSFNEFGDPGAVMIADGLMQNPSLKHISLRGNRITTEGGRALARAFKKHKSLATVKLQRQGLLDLKESGIIDAVRASQQIVEVDFNHDAYELVRHALLRNRQSKIVSAGPELEEKQRQLENERATLLHTHDLIADEQRRREKQTEALKTLRDRQKAALAVYQNEIQDLTEQHERGLYAKRKIEINCKMEEDAIDAKKNKLQSDKSVLMKRIEDVANNRTRIQSQVAKLKLKVAAKKAEGTEELQKELSAIQVEIDESRNLCEIFQRRIAECTHQDQLVAVGKTKKGKKGKKGKK